MSAMTCGFNSRPVHSMKLLIASRNSNKIAEIHAIFDLPTIELISLRDRPDWPEVVEDGRTFQANAVKKAVSLALAGRCWALADDSGLEVDALDGLPGVQSARYAGEPVNPTANNTKLLKALQGQQQRQARFQCVLALANAEGRAQIVEGTCSGRIIHECRGSGGFGYDPLFVPDGHTQTFAEMAAELKNQISHRARALCLARQQWGEMLSRASQVWLARRELSAQPHSPAAE